MNQKTLREDRRGADKGHIALQSRLAQEFTSELLIRTLSTSQVHNKSNKKGDERYERKCSNSSVTKGGRR